MRPRLAARARGSLELKRWRASPAQSAPNPSPVLEFRLRDGKVRLSNSIKRKRRRNPATCHNFFPPFFQRGPRSLSDRTGAPAVSRMSYAIIQSCISATTYLTGTRNPQAHGVASGTDALCSTFRTHDCASVSARLAFSCRNLLNYGQSHPMPTPLNCASRTTARAGQVSALAIFKVMAS